MADLSHWDFAEHFRGKEVAELIMGIPPEANGELVRIFGDKEGYATKITPLLRRMERALSDGLNTLKQAATWGGNANEALIRFPLVPLELHSETMVSIRDAATEFGLAVFRDTDWTGTFGKAYFGRSEIVRWLDAIEMKSIYMFDHKQPTKPDAALEADIDPADLPEELHAANIAFRAVNNLYGDPSATFRNRLISYLKTNFPDLSSDAVKRIATVANPDKAPGRKNFNAE